MVGRVGSEGFDRDEARTFVQSNSAWPCGHDVKDHGPVAEVAGDAEKCLNEDAPGALTSVSGTNIEPSDLCLFVVEWDQHPGGERGSGIVDADCDVAGRWHRPPRQTGDLFAKRQWEMVWWAAMVSPGVRQANVLIDKVGHSGQVLGCGAQQLDGPHPVPIMPGRQLVQQVCSNYPTESGTGRPTGPSPRDDERGP